MAAKISYTEPQVCDHGGNLAKPWFIYFDITNRDSGVTLRRQFRGGINYETNPKMRRQLANALLRFWKEKLQAGWHPFEIEEKKEEAEKDPYADLGFNAAVDMGFEKSTTAASTKRSYKPTRNFIKEAAVRLGLDKTAIADIRRKHIKLLMEDVKVNKSWSNKAYNKNLAYLSAILGNLIEWEVLENNPVNKIKPLPVTETEKYVPLTDEEKNAVRDYLFINHYRFLVYILVIYHTGIRPKEILSLKIKDIDLNKNLITIIPDFILGNSKTSKIRKVPINTHLAPFLRELKLHEYQPEYYVFGSNCAKGEGNRGAKPLKKYGAKGSDYFKPSLTQIKRNTVTRLWKEIIVEKLGINKHLYALKHTGANDKILAGVSLDALKELYGHSSSLMTEKYATKIKEVHRKQIIELSPNF